MWPFRKQRAPREVDLTSEGYERWLWAQRPQPLSWFLSLSLIEQQQLAILGRTYVEDCAIAVGYAVRDPAATEAGLAAKAGSIDAEADLVQQLALRAMQKMTAQAPAATSTPKAPAPRRPVMGPTGRKVTPP